jgi:COMPASS component SPP1
MVVARASIATIDPNADGEGDDEQEISIYCITCGHEIHARTGVRHMEKCFNKVNTCKSI